MNETILRELFNNGGIDSSATKKLGVASYSYQKTISDLYWLGVVSKNKSRLSVSLLDNPVSGVLKKLFFEGLDSKLLSKKNLEWFSKLIEPKTTLELALTTNKSVPQTNQLLKKFSGFISKEKNRFILSQTNQDLFTLVSLIRMNRMKNFVWEKGGEGLEKIPLNFEVKGTLTGFSRFTEFGLMINPAHNYVYSPKKELSLEEILVHSIKFADNPNDLTLCVLFYLKNKVKANIKEIEKKSKKFGVLEIWFDIINYVDEQVVKNPSLFLPKNEFLQKIRLYGVELPSRFNQESIQTLFKEISTELKETTPIYFIGGNALIEHKTKNSTKDVDVVLTNKKQAENFVSALKRIGFTSLAEKEFQYGELEASTMLVRKGSPRIDLFIKKICGVLEFSNRMQFRSKKINQDKAEIYLTSLEDVFLLKSISFRDSDLIDCENILQKTTLNWEIIFNEIIAQEKNFKKNQELIILDHLEALKNRMNIQIPLTKKITALCLEKSILFLAQQPITIKEIKQKISFPETTIRNHITKLVKQKKLKRTSKKPLRIQKI